MEESGTSELFTRQLPVFTEAGQKKLQEANVLIIGCGGLGSSCATVLSRSGIGHLVLVDEDVVSMSNIHRQFLYSPGDVSNYKVEVAAKSPLLCLSKVTPVCTHVDENVVKQLIDQYRPAVVMDCTDNFDVRFAVNKACADSMTPMIFGAVTGGEGQVSVFCHTSACPTCPCLACIYPDGMPLGRPPPVIPAICAVVASIQAEQAIAILTGVGKVLVGEFMTINLMKMNMRTFKVRDRVQNCKVCGLGEILKNNE